VVETRPTRDLIREPERLGASLTTRFRDALEALPVALMRDMWLTGFDTPSLHTMDVDKPMRSHGLMQVMARETSIQGPGRRARGGLPGPRTGKKVALASYAVDYEPAFHSNISHVAALLCSRKGLIVAREVHPPRKRKPTFCGPRTCSASLPLRACDKVRVHHLYKPAGLW
jgi:hypothetical protein